MLDMHGGIGSWDRFSNFATGFDFQHIHTLQRQMSPSTKPKKILQQEVEMPNGVDDELNNWAGLGCLLDQHQKLCAVEQAKPKGGKQIQDSI